MGSLLMAQCNCGFESGMVSAGGGMMNFNEVLNAPALCRKCQIVLVKNYLEHDPRCPHCGGKIHFYNDPALFKGGLPKDTSDCLFYWRLPDGFDSIYPEIDNFFCLPNTDYICPQCGKMHMKFINIGFWD
jgi:Zn finger protein HypA/HybF involved in hydrogenase expression